MLSIATGHSVAYLTGPIAQGREGYYQAAVDAGGEPPGLWYGAGAEALGLRGQVDNEVMEALYSHFCDPRDPAALSEDTRGEARTLGAPGRHYRSAGAQFKEMLAKEPGASPERRAEIQRQAEANARQAVRFFDATFSPGKDVTVLAVAFERAANDARRAGDEQAAEAWAGMARAVEEGVMVGARASVDFLQDAAGYARVGDHASRAGRWVDAHQFVVAQFLQHDSREKDPQLHVHQAILNKVLDKDGQWRALDSKALHMLRGAAGAVGERAMEAALTRTLGVRFETRPDGKARQVVGVDQAVMDLFSSRSRTISDKAAEMFREFATYRGREPNALEQTRIRLEIALSSRKAKSHEAEDPAERSERWERESQQVLAGGLGQVAHNALHAGQGVQAEAWSVQDVLDRAIDRVADKKGSWTRGDLMRAVSDVLPANLGVDPDKIPALLGQLADKALDQVERVSVDERVDDLPAELRLANGDSSYARPYSARYAAPEQFAAARALRAAAVERGAAAMSMEEAQAFVDRFAENGKELGADQKAAMLGVLTSGARVDVILSAAGTGKSFTVGAIAEAWRSTGRQVYGLAAGQAQADVLTQEGVQSFNITRWLGGKNIPALQPGDIVVVDEASMASTPDLAEIAERVRAADAKLVPVGDTQQLGAVGAGGGFAEIAERAARYELTEVRRFNNDWEGVASLQLRNRDEGVLDDYDKHGRIRGAGTQEQAAAAAARAWLADTVSGKESLLVVGSNAAAYAASAQLRAELVRLGRVEAEGVQLGMDQNTAGVGDLVQGRRNGWELTGWEGNQWCPINRGSYRVVGVREDGGLAVEPAKGGPVVQLPASYVREHLTLSYASTVHAAEGRTVDTAHGVVGGGTDAAAAYVMATRGREANTMWVVTRHTGQDAHTGETQDVEHRAAKAVLEDVLRRSEVESTPLTEQTEAREKAAEVMTPLERLSAEADKLNSARTSHLLDLAAATGEITDEQRVRLAADPAMEGLARVLRQAEVAGHDPAKVLGHALQGRSLDNATSPAAVLHHRVRETTNLTAELTSAADLVPRGLPAVWATYFDRLADDADTRRHELGAQAAQERPDWAVQALGPVPEDPAARQAWEQRAGWAAASRESVGHTDSVEPLSPSPAAGMAEKRALWVTAHKKLDLPDRSPEEAEMSDGALRNRVAAWDRERLWAPRWVGDELSATSEQLATRRTDATLWAEKAERQDLPAGEREQLRTAAGEAAKEAIDLAEKVKVLEEADKVRTSWYLHTLQTRDNAERAKVELGSRDVDLADPGDRVYAAEWLELEAQVRAEDDDHREISEHDMAEDIPAAELGDEVVLETAAADVRATAVPDPSEFADVAPSRTIPSMDDLAATVSRYREALLEIERRAADDAAAQQADWAQWADHTAQQQAQDADAWVRS